MARPPEFFLKRGPDEYLDINDRALDFSGRAIKIGRAHQPRC